MHCYYALCPHVFVWYKNFVSIDCVCYIYLLIVTVPDACFRLEGLLPFLVYLPALFAGFNGVIWLFILLGILILMRRWWEILH